MHTISIHCQLSQDTMWQTSANADLPRKVELLPVRRISFTNKGEGHFPASFVLNIHSTVLQKLYLWHFS